MTRTPAWLPILTFSLLAMLISGLFRLGFLDFYNRDTLHFLFALAGVTIFVGWGPAVAAGLTQRLFRESKSDISLVGLAGPGPLYMAFIPAVLLGIVGIPNHHSMNAHILGVCVGLLVFIYALGEEIGWRGYLHSHLPADRPWLRAFVIATIWWAWHLWFLTNPSPITMVINFGLLVAASYALSVMIESSRSLLAVAAFHSVGNLGFMGTAINLPDVTRLIIAAVALALMILIYHRFQPKETST